MGHVYISNLCMHVKIGRNATLYQRTIFEIAEKAQVSIGYNFTLSYGAVIASTYFIRMGNNVMIGEYTSVRDTTHSNDNPLLPYCMQEDKSEKIMIGNNVWIGRGCIVLPGSVIEDGVIVGANSVVKGTLKGNCLYAGNPVKLIKSLVPESLPARSPEPVINFS